MEKTFGIIMVGILILVVALGFYYAH